MRGSSLLNFKSVWPVVLLALAALGGCRSSSPPGNPPVTTAPLSGAGKLTYVQIDVGQGDSELILSPDGHAMLVDAGLPGHADEILDVLKQHGVEHLDYLVESHPHSDHIGSMRQVIENGPSVGTFLASGYQHNSQVQLKLLQAVRDKKIKGQLARTGGHYTLGDSVTFDVLQPKAPLLKGTDSDPNNNSVVLRVSYGNTRFLLTGDMEEDERERLLTTRDDLQSDVLKAAHHGSRNGIDLGFLRRVRPKIVMISCAVGNDYDHPHAEAMELLKEANATVYRTDLQGTVTLVSDGNSIEASVERQATLPLTLTGKEVAARSGETPHPTRSDEGDLTPSKEDAPQRNPRAGNPDQPAESPIARQEGTVERGPIIGNRRSKVYHREDSGAQLPAPENRVYFQSEADAKKAGFRPARK